MDALSGVCGSVVALEPDTGRLLVSASSPSYDPNLVEEQFGQIRQIESACEPAAPLVNRATGDLFIPGSTFKVVTATAALDSGRYTPESRFDDPGYCIEYGQRVSNYSDQGGPQVYGNIDFGDRHGELGQLRLLQHRQGARPRSDPRLRGALRLLRGSAARDAVRGTAGRAASTTTASSTGRRIRRTSIPAGSRSARSACS